MRDIFQGPGGMLLSMRETMRRIGAEKDTIYRLIEAGHLECFRFTDGGWHWVYERSVKQYLSRRTRHNGPSQKKRRSAKR